MILGSPLKVPRKPPKPIKSKDRRQDLLDTIDQEIETEVQKWLNKRHPVHLYHPNDNNNDVNDLKFSLGNKPGFAQRLSLCNRNNRPAILRSDNHCEYHLSKPNRWKPIGPIHTKDRSVFNQSAPLRNISDLKHWKNTLRNPSATTAISPNMHRRTHKPMTWQRWQQQESLRAAKKEQKALEEKNNAIMAGLANEPEISDENMFHHPLRKKSAAHEQVNAVLRPRIVQTETPTEKTLIGMRPTPDVPPSASINTSNSIETTKPLLAETSNIPVQMSHVPAKAPMVPAKTMNIESSKKHVVPLYKGHTSVQHFWTTKQDEYLLRLVELHGRKWGTIKKEFNAWVTNSTGTTTKSAGTDTHVDENRTVLTIPNNFISGPICRKRFLHLKSLAEDASYDSEEARQTIQGLDKFAPRVVEMTHEELLQYRNHRRLRYRCRSALVQHLHQVQYLIEETNRIEDFFVDLEELEKTDHDLEHRETFIMRHLIRICRQLGIPIVDVEEMRELAHIFVHEIGIVPVHPFTVYSDILTSIWRGWHRVTAHDRETQAKEHLKHVIKNRIQRKLMLSMEKKNIELKSNIYYIEEDYENQDEFITFTRKTGEDCVHRIHEWIDHAHTLFFAFTENQELFVKKKVKECFQVAIKHEAILPIGRRRIKQVKFDMFWKEIFDGQDADCLKHKHGVDLHLFLQHLSEFEAMHSSFVDAHDIFN